MGTGADPLAVEDPGQSIRNGARMIDDVSAWIKTRAGAGTLVDHASPRATAARAALVGKRWRGDKRRAQRARAAALRLAKRQAAADAAAALVVEHPDRAVTIRVVARTISAEPGGAAWRTDVIVRAAAAVISVPVLGLAHLSSIRGAAARYVAAADRLDYGRWWTDRPVVAVREAARRAARSCRAGKVLSTSRDEAAAEARAVYLSTAARYVDHGVADWYDGPLWATVDGATQRAAVAAARAALRGDKLGGVTGRDDGNGGVVAFPVSEGPDGDPCSSVRSIAQGDWINMDQTNSEGDTVSTPFRRPDAVGMIDLGARMLIEDRGTTSEDDASARIASDAVALCQWLSRRRQFADVATRSALFGGAVGQGQVAALASARERGQSMAGKVAAVIAAMASGDSLPVACEAVGWSSADGCKAWRQAVNRLTAGAGLPSAWRDYRASERAGA